MTHMNDRQQRVVELARELLQVKNPNIYTPVGELSMSIHLLQQAAANVVRLADRTDDEDELQMVT